MTVSLSIRKTQGQSARAFEAISGYTGWLTGKRLGIGVAFVALYLIAERLFLIHEIAPLNIDPWSPSAGMAVALLLAAGFAYTPFVLCATLLSSIFIYQAPYGVLAASAPAVLLALGLVILAYVIRFVLHFDLPVISLPDTVLLDGGSMPGCHFCPCLLRCRIRYRINSQCILP
jgi:hypothetical protein